MEEHIGPSLIPPTNIEGLRTPPRMSKMAEGPRVLKKRPKLKVCTYLFIFICKFLIMIICSLTIMYSLKFIHSTVEYM